MDTTTLHIKTTLKTRNEAQEIAEKFGFSLTSLVNALLKQTIRTKRIALDLEEPTQYMLDSLRKSEDEVKAGRVSPSFTNVNDAMAWLDNPNAKDKNGNKIHDTI
jgi:addiction module RelB/DinJ family antitoxin